MEPHHPPAVAVLDHQLEERVRGGEVAHHAVARERLAGEREAEPAARRQPEHGEREGGEAEEEVAAVLRAGVAARRQLERGGDRADAARRVEEPVAERVGPEHRPREHRQQQVVLDAEPGHDAEQEEQVAERGRAPHVAEAGEEARAERLRRPRALARRKAHERERHQDRDVARGVQKEARRLAERGDQRPRQRRPHQARPVEDGGVERDRVREILGARHLHQERLPGGHVERAHQPDAAREEDDERHGDGASPHQHAEGECQESEQRLRHQQHAAARQAIGDHARDGRQAEDRQVARDRHLAEVERAALEAVDQPALRHALHPVPDERDALPHHEKAEVAVAERGEAGEETAHGAGLEERLGRRPGKHPAL